MPRNAARRPWVKLYCHGRLHGSVVYQLTEAEQSVWDKLLCLTGLCGLGGLIGDNDRRAFPHQHVAHELHTTLDLLESTLKKCIEEGRIKEDAEGIHITNWLVYQSEYDRQKPYRKQGTAQSPPPQPELANPVKAGHKAGTKVEELVIIPDYLDKDTWAAFLDMRWKIKAPLTQRAKKLLLGELEKLKAQGHPPNKVLEQSIMNSWKSVYPLKGGQGGQGVFTPGGYNKPKAVPGNKPAGALDDITEEP